MYNRILICLPSMFHQVNDNTRTHTHALTYTYKHTHMHTYTIPENDDALKYRLPMILLPGNKIKTLITGILLGRIRSHSFETMRLKRAWKDLNETSGMVLRLEILEQNKTEENKPTRILRDRLVSSYSLDPQAEDKSMFKEVHLSTSPQVFHDLNLSRSP